MKHIRHNNNCQEFHAVIVLHFPVTKFNPILKILHLRIKAH